MSIGGGGGRGAVVVKIDVELSHVRCETRVRQKCIEVYLNHRPEQF